MTAAEYVAEHHDLADAALWRVANPLPFTQGQGWGIPPIGTETQPGCTYEGDLFGVSCFRIWHEPKWEPPADGPVRLVVSR